MILGYDRSTCLSTMRSSHSIHTSADGAVGEVVGVAILPLPSVSWRIVAESSEGFGVSEIEGSTHHVSGQLARGMKEWFAKERLLAVWNEHDTRALAEIVTEDVVWIDPTLVEPAHGIAGVRRFMENSWRAMPDLHFDIIGPPCYADDTQVLMVQWKMTGTHLGRFDPPGFAPTGRRIDVDGVDVYTFRENKIAHYVAYYDVCALSRQLGFLPSTGSLAEKTFVATQRLGSQLSKLRRQVIEGLSDTV